MRNGYRYTRKRVNRVGRTVWRCVDTRKCNSVMVTHHSFILKEERHICQPDKEKNIIKERISACIARAQNEDAPMQQIFSDIINDLKQCGIDSSRLPKFDNIKKTLYKYRNMQRENPK